MIEKLKKYQEEIEEQALMPSFFDPRYFHQLSNTEKIQAVNRIKTIIEKTDPPADKPQPKPKPKGFYEVFAPHTQALPSTLDKAASGFPELEEYLQIFSIDVKESPLLWWSVNEARFPKLAVLARNHLAMLATTVPSEAAFSAAGNILNKKRNKLDTKTVEGLMIAYSWKRYQRSLKQGK